MVIGSFLPAASKRMRGFTLIEMLLALTLIALLLTIAAPRYFASLERAKEAALKEDLHIMRKAIDQFHGDTGNYPDSLAQLTEKKYIREVPVDPLTDSADSWVTSPPKNPEDKGIADIRSGAQGRMPDGKNYADL